jgi:hypothetical protein
MSATAAATTVLFLGRSNERNRVTQSTPAPRPPKQPVSFLVIGAVVLLFIGIVLSIVSGIAALAALGTLSIIAGLSGVTLAVLSLRE